MTTAVDGTRKSDGTRGDCGIVVAAIEYLTICVLILAFNTVWTRTDSLYSHVPLIKLAACTVGFVLPLIWAVKKPAGKLSMLPFVLVAGLGFCVSYFLTSNIAASLIAYLPVIMSCAYAEFCGGFETITRFLTRYVNVVLVLAGISLFFFVFGSTLHLIDPTGTVSYQWEVARRASSYWSLYFETQTIDFLSYSGIRNDGVFCEAPMFNFVLCLALMTNVLLLKGSRLKSLFLCVTILTTFSTTGYLAVLIVGAYLLMVAKVSNRLINALRILLIPILVVGIIIACALILGDKSDTGSYGVRSDHLIGCTQLFFESLPLGTGFGDDALFYSVFRFDQGLSVGSMYLLAQGGAFAVALYVVPTFYALFSGLRRKDWAFVAFQLAFAWLVFITQVITLPVFWLFTFLVLYKWPMLVADRSNCEEVAG